MRAECEQYGVGFYGRPPRFRIRQLECCSTCSTRNASSAARSSARRSGDVVIDDGHGICLGLTMAVEKRFCWNMKLLVEFKMACSSVGGLHCGGGGRIE